MEQSSYASSFPKEEVFHSNLCTLRELSPGISDENLSKFLKFKCDVTQALERLDAHCTFRIKNSWVDDPPLRAGSDDQLKRILESELVSCPEGMKDKMGRPVIFVRFANNDMSDGRTAYDISRAAFYTLERMLNRDDVTEHGIVGVYDLGGFKGNMNIAMPKDKGILQALSGGKLPLRINAFYFVNTPWYMKAFFRVASLFISKKLRQRVRILEDFTEIHHFIALDNFPEDYGGQVHHNQREWVAQQINAEEQNSKHLLEELVLPASSS